MKRLATNPIPYDYIETAQKQNSDGYGVSWHDGTTLHTYKTLDFEDFNHKLEQLEQYDLVVHLRNTSAGTTCINNAHPFTVPSGVVFHNGTISSLKSGLTGPSDTATLASIISSCNYSNISDIEPLITTIIGTAYNKLVFFNNDGTITIINENLGIKDDNGNWYSNDYHVEVATSNVFVYGTLKFGFHNHSSWMRGTEYIDSVTTVEKWAMIGKNSSFPYLLCEHLRGHHIKGELYSATADQIAHLDILEGVPSHYIKKEIEVLLSDGKTKVKAITYVKAKIHASDLTDNEFIEEFHNKPKYQHFKGRHYDYDDY
jgi:gamma-glutamylcyclotransferase (GGCT)/AIG2-like uncharacterized protein YtfP